MSFYFTVPVFKWELIDYFKKMYIKSSATCGYILIQVISLGKEVYSQSTIKINFAFLNVIMVD